MYRIFDIKRYSINDGPGIRITFFFKGCPLSCLWCHNPEGISRTQTRMYTPSKCILCGACVHFCPSGALSMPGRGASGAIRCDASKCTLCGKCAEACPTKAVEMAARTYTAEQIYTEIAKERPFFESSGGGVTFSGGEPLYQGDSIITLLGSTRLPRPRLVRRKVHRALRRTRILQEGIRPTTSIRLTSPSRCR